jgi:NAD(P)-dependent dehydrogenase (short-subunit alcohol dehydrogenase family)
MAKVMLVTGGGRGIGAATARLAAERGYSVCVNYLRDESAAQRLVKEISGKAIAVAGDVSQEADVLRLFEAVDRKLGRIDALVNNAGIVDVRSRVDEMTVPRLQRMFAVNVIGSFLCAREAIKRMSRKHGGAGGAIVNISSINGIAAAPNAGAYTASKAGVIMLTQHMALEWGGAGVRVNAVAPGLINAGMSDAIYADPEVRRLRQGRVPLGRLGTAEDVAETVLFLGSDRAAYVTGQTVAVDGGITVSALNSMPRPASVDSVGLDGAG